MSSFKRGWRLNLLREYDKKIEFRLVDPKTDKYDPITESDERLLKSLKEVEKKDEKKK